MDHNKALMDLCRVCGKSVMPKSAKVKHLCSDYKHQLTSVFGIDVDSDDPSVHPRHFCHPCRLVIHKYTTATKEYRHKTVPFGDWCKHDDNSCHVCDHYSTFQKGGRPCKRVCSGRPPGVSSRYCLEYVNKLVPDPSHPPFTVCHLNDHQVLDVSKLQCPICCDLLCAPVELVTCGSVVCAQCCCGWLKHSNKLTCPCCYSCHISDFNTIRPASPLILSMLGSLCVVCDECHGHVRLEKLNEHVASSCSIHTRLPSATVSIEQVLKRPTTAPLTPLEHQLQTRLVKRSLSTSPEERVLQVKTGGQPMTLVQIRKPRVPSGKARPSTIRERSHSLSSLRNKLSAGDTVSQFSHELRTCNSDDRKRVLEELGGAFEVHIPTESLLAFKADLNVPWNKLRTIKRWLDMWGVATASEKSMREEAKQLIGDNLKAELVPLTFKHRDGGEVIKEAAMAYIPDLWLKISELLDQNSDESKRISRVTWHNGAIPDEEVWLKLGGDKGGGTFKLCFQHLNVPSPNSPDNTCIFTLFEAPDNYMNLSVAFERYKGVLTDMESQTWREKKVRMFLCGDYEFLCLVFGLSGASGRHCCLWCLITQDQLKLSPSVRGPVTLRTTQSIIDDNDRFKRAGAIIRNAKFFNNCIHRPFVTSLPLSQVCPPGLHITLGIFLRLFVLLEDSCHEMDLLAELQGSGEGRSYEKYVTALRHQRALKDEEHVTKYNLSVLEQVATYTLTTAPNTASLPAFTQVTSEIARKKEQLKQLQGEISKLESVLTQGFHKDEGPFVKALDKALASFHVQRQAYYSGSFVGNHVHRALKASNIETLCGSVVQVAQQHCPALLSRAQSIQQKFKQVLELFHSCHKLYDSSTLTEEEITELEKNIKKFMSYYRQTFPDSSVLPKMHFLEEHVVPWIKKWKIGFGFMGEQGAESIHAYF